MTRETGSKAIQSVLSIDRFTEVSESQSIQPRKQGERKVVCEDTDSRIFE